MWRLNSNSRTSLNCLAQAGVEVIQHKIEKMSEETRAIHRTELANREAADKMSGVERCSAPSQNVGL
jgi:hypothetical protein